MSDLETRYRRLLRAYPADHRDTYEREMLGVLMDGARPGQRLPGPGEAFDLVRAGLSARAGVFLRSERDTGWRNAAAVAGLLVAVLLAGVAVRRMLFGVEVMLVWGDPMQAYGVRGLLMADVVARTVVWLAVVAAAMAGRRRIAFALAVGAATVETATMVGWAGRLLSGRLLPVLVVAVLLGAALRARTVRRSIGARRGWLLAGAVLASTMTGVASDTLPYWLVAGITPSAALRWAVPALGMATGVLLAMGLRGVEPSLRRRILVLLAPPALVLLAHTVSNVSLIQVLSMMTATAVAIGTAFVLLRRHEAHWTRRPAD